jgi:TP901 family phage tail tape measure protein
MADFEKVYQIKFNTTSAQENLKRLNVQMIKIRRSIDKVGSSMVKNVDRIGTRSVKNIEAASKKAGDAMVKNLDKRGTRSIKNVEVASKSAKKSINNLRKSTVRAGDALKKFGQNFRRYVALPIAVGGVAAIKFARDFNKGMANVASLLPGQTEKIEGFKKSLMTMSAESGKSLEDLTGGLYETVSAFGDTGDSIDRLNIATKASVAGLSSTKESLSLLSAVTKGYGDTSIPAMQKASDLAFQTVKDGQTTFAELAASMGKVIPLAAQFETKQETLFGTMATLTGVTGNAAEVSTQLSSIYSAALKPTEALTEVANKYGHESAAAMLKTEKFNGFLEIMRKETDGNEAALGKLISRKEAQVAILALLGGQSDTYTQKLENMKNVTNATSIAFQEQTDGVNKAGHSFEQTKRRMINLAVRVGDKLLPVVSRLLDRIEPLIKYFEDLDDEAIDFYITLGKWAVLLGMGSKLMVGMSSFTNMITGMGGAGGSMAAASSGVKGLIGKVSVLAQTFGAAYVAGSALSELYLQPQSQKREDVKTSLADSDIEAERIAKYGTLEEKQAALSRIKTQRAGLDSGTSLEEIVGTLIDPTGVGEKKGLAKARSEAAMKTLESSISHDKQRQELLAEGGTMTRGGGGGTMTQTVNQTNNIYAQSASPAGVVKELERTMKRSIPTIAPPSQ